MEGNVLCDSTSICDKFNSFFINIHKYIENNTIKNYYNVIDDKKLHVNCHNNNS